MKRTYLLWLIVLVLIATLGPIIAFAAKIQVRWTAPTKNTDGSPLTDLAGYRVEWGSCNKDGSFGVYQAGINAPATAVTSWIYPTKLSPVCARLYAINVKGLLSAPAYASGPALPKLSQPTH